MFLPLIFCVACFAIENVATHDGDLIKTKADLLGERFKNNVNVLKNYDALDIVFLIDSSSSVGEDNFRSEIKFVKKLLSDVTIDYNHTRVAVITFSSADNIVKNVDEMTVPRTENNKCLLLNKQLPAINYTGGETYTLGAFQLAKHILKNARPDSKKVIFLITDGFSNGGDPVPVAEELKNQDVVIFTIGIKNGNYKELHQLSTAPGENYTYLLDSFEEFESMARALHVDLQMGDYIPLGINSPCDYLCKEGGCCHFQALCSCGTITGHYSCICPAGYYGSGLKDDDGCSLCPVGFYSDGPNSCTPCPDDNHVTKSPAIGKKSCQCKDGFKVKSDDDDKCEEIACNVLLEPKNGYFVDECINKPNSTCEARCNVGFVPLSSMKKTCLINETWIGDDFNCQEITCPKLPVPDQGSVICINEDLSVSYDEKIDKLPVDTLCWFQCNNGTILEGSEERYCLPEGQWDGKDTSCNYIKCSKLPTILKAIYEPNTCDVNKQPYGQSCIVNCEMGYKLNGPSVKDCMELGQWDSDEYPTCEDFMPPKIECPKDVVGTAKLGHNYGYVLWEAPDITDNSDDELTIWTDPPITDTSSYLFLIGKTNVTYYAQDLAGNRGECTITVTILDKERPIIENCISPPIFPSSDRKGANVTWEEPFIYDNSHHATVTRSHSSGYFETGTTIVTYTATDGSGNKNICQVNITVGKPTCDQFPTPQHGISNCFQLNEVENCLLSCLDGYAVPLPWVSVSENSYAVLFICDPVENIWYNEDDAAPECVKIELPDSVGQNGVGKMDDLIDDCEDDLNDLENEIRTDFTNDVCLANCSVEMDAECFPELDEERDEENTNRIARQVDQKPKRNGRKRVGVKIKVVGKYVNDSQVFTDIHFKNITFKFEDPFYLCPSGYIVRKNRCVKCPKGTHQIKNKCRSCPIGTYNPYFGKTSCAQCPPHYSTKRPRSKSIIDCKKQCPPGTHARKINIRRNRPKHLIERLTLQPFCKTCQMGKYQYDWGQSSCLSCPEGYTTTSFGSKDVSQCIETAKEICLKSTNICNFGVCEPISIYHYRCNCTEGYIGSHCEKRINVCQTNLCKNGGSCVVIDDGIQMQYKCICLENYFGSFCEHRIIRCNLRCQNGGSCIEHDDSRLSCVCPRGFEGPLCEKKVYYCEQNYCQNNSTCIESVVGYKCICRQGFLGRRCNLLPCDYKPCSKNGVCHNLLEKNTSPNSYRCECGKGYTGKNCDIKIDFCSKNLCKNNGVCVSLTSTFHCICKEPFYGITCEKLYDDDYVLNFERYRITDYIRLPKFDKNLKEISACMWVKSTDTFNYGTLISYATREYDNAFTLMDYTGLILYVNNQYISTDITLNDGLWHHVCATWTTRGGKYHVYLDGILKKSGEGLSSKKEIVANGQMIIGQEQDIIGGRFSQAESFIGQMTYANIWNYSLSENEIKKHYYDCKDDISGNLYRWSVFQQFLRGGIKKQKSNFCQECPPPKKIIDGIIDLRNDYAFYSCKTGFKIGNRYANGRRCLKSSTWEGIYEPYCTRIFCRHPGYLKNGYIYGTGFYYGDKVICSCNEGFNLNGSQSLTCGKDGTWYPEKPKCIGLQCKAFKKPEFSKINILAEITYEEYKENITEFDIGNQIEIVCLEESNLIGESLVTCQDDGTWDSDPPKCVKPVTTTLLPISTTPEITTTTLKPTTLKLIETTSYKSTTILHTTESDLITTTIIPETTTQAPSTTDLPLPTIKEDKKCPINNVPLPPSNGYIVESSVENFKKNLTNTIEYKCSNNFKLSGQEFVICNEDGTWGNLNMECKAIPLISCKPPKIPLNMIQNNHHDVYIPDDTVNFSCIKGYNTLGRNVIRCLKNGRWSRLSGKCRRIPCRRPPVAEEAQVIGGSYLYNDTVTVVCPNKSKFDLKCNSDGKWIGNYKC